MAIAPVRCIHNTYPDPIKVSISSVSVSHSTSTLTLMAAFSRLLPILATTCLVQTAGGLVSIPLQSELTFDLAGLFGFVASTLVSLFYQSIKEGKALNLSARQILLNGTIVVWSARLGLLLFLKGLRLRNDTRLDHAIEIKYKPLKFAAVCLMQATWIFFVGLPVYLANTLGTSRQIPLGAKDYIPLGLFASSFLLEVVADVQNYKWQNTGERSKHCKKTLKSGIFTWARHSNYTSEIGVWLGIWALASSTLQSSPYPRLAPIIAAVSPLLTWHFVTSYSQTASGLPLWKKPARRTAVDYSRYTEYINRVPWLCWW